MNERFASVWHAISDTPGEAETMRLRASLMIALAEHFEREGMSQAQAAELLGIEQPRVSDLIRGRIDQFSSDILFNMLSAAGLHVDVQIAKAT